MKKIIKSLIFLSLVFGCNDITGPGFFPGEYFLVISNQNDNIELGKLSIDGNQYATLYRNNPTSELINFAQLSPDHKLIVICGGPNPSYGLFPIWILSSDGNLIYQVTTNGYRPRWSLDGHWIYYSKQVEPASGDHDLCRYNINENTEETLLYGKYVEIEGELHYIDYLLSDISKININEIFVLETDLLIDENYYVISETVNLFKYNVITGSKEYLNINKDPIILGFGSINPNDSLFYYTSTDTASPYRGFLNSFNYISNEINTIFYPKGDERILSFAFSPQENELSYVSLGLDTLPDYRPAYIFSLIKKNLNSGEEVVISTPEKEVRIMQWIVNQN